MLHVPPGQGHPSRQLYGMVALDDLGHHGVGEVSVISGIIHHTMREESSGKELFLPVFAPMPF